MSDRDLTKFIAACQAYKTNIAAFGLLNDENDMAWNDNGWRAAYNEYFELRAALPNSIIDPDQAMPEWHPFASETYEQISRHSVEYAAARNELLNRKSTLFRAAMTELATAMSPVLLDAVESRDGTDLFEMMTPIFEEASAIRREHLDGKNLTSFDPEGAFSTTLLKPVAEHFGVDVKRRAWALETSHAYTASLNSPAPR